MIHTITATNNLQAWQQACLYLKNNGRSCFNLLLEIDNPTDFTDLNLWMTDRNPINYGGQDNIYDVVNTIFPYRFYERNTFTNRENFYERYRDIYLRGKSINPRQSWGTYIQRLISYSKHFNDFTAPNQIENSIIALQRNITQKSSITYHLSSSNMDICNTRLRGAPCWHFGELLCHSNTNTVDFLVVYRNHDYFNKTLGNLIALSKLLNFLCTESGRTPGRLIVHSANAYYSCNNNSIDNITA